MLVVRATSRRSARDQTFFLRLPEIAAAGPGSPAASSAPSSVAAVTTWVIDRFSGVGAGWSTCALWIAADARPRTRRPRGGRTLPGRRGESETRNDGRVPYTVPRDRRWRVIEMSHLACNVVIESCGPVATGCGRGPSRKRSSTPSTSRIIRVPRPTECVTARRFHVEKNTRAAWRGRRCRVRPVLYDRVEHNTFIRTHGVHGDFRFRTRRTIDRFRDDVYFVLLSDFIFDFFFLKTLFYSLNTV